MERIFSKYSLKMEINESIDIPKAKAVQPCLGARRRWSRLRALCLELLGLFDIGALSIKIGFWGT